MAWFLLPLVAGPGLSDAVDGRSGTVQLVAEAGLWGGWALGLLATLVPSTVSLTALRILAPAAVAAALLGIASAGRWQVSAVVALGAIVVVAAVVFLPTTGDVMVNGSAYGAERRMALRAPASLVIGPVPLVWALVFAGAVTGPLLWAAGRWELGAPLTVLGLVVVVFGARSLHRLSRRWVVFVPAGFVLHDRFTLAESLMVRRGDVTGLGPAPSDLDGVVDLTAGAAGLALVLDLGQPAKVGIRHRSGRIDDIEVRRVAFTPSLPGLLLREARARQFPVGS